MIFRLIVWGSMAFLPVLIYFMLRNETKFKKNIVLEVTFPYQAREDAEVQKIIHQFLRWERWILWILLGLIVPGVMIKSIGLSMTAMMTWLVVAIILPYVPYVLANRDLKQLKLKRGWKREDRDVKHVQLAAMPAPRWLSGWWFVPALILSLLPLIWERGNWLLYLIMAVTVVSFWLGYRFMYRNKSEMIDDNIALTQALTRIRRYNWGKVWLVSAYGMGLFSLVFALFPYQTLWQGVFILVITLVIVIVAVQAEFKLRHLQEELTKDSGKDWYVDDDDHWLGGVLYYNPNDSRLLINSRVGVNTTFNAAKPAGKVILVLVALLILGMPLFGVWMMNLENEPVTLTLSELTLESSKYILERGQLEEIELLETLPEKMVRTWGNAMETKLSGRFSIHNLGTVLLDLDPTISPYLLIKTEDQRYLLGTRDSEGTRQIYQELLKQLNK